MSQQADRAVDAALDEEGIVSEEQEWREYSIRKRHGKCTCDLLEPYGHVTCPACNDA